MGKPAAKRGDRVMATDTHIILVPSPSGPIPTPLPHPFIGILDGGLSPDVTIMGQPAAVVGSTATNTPPHVPQGGSFQKPPGNRAQVVLGSTTVLINGKGAARLGDTASTCNDPVDLPIGKIVTQGGTVLFGG